MFPQCDDLTDYAERIGAFLQRIFRP
jgi:hypothetical protein